MAVLVFGGAIFKYQLFLFFFVDLDSVQRSAVEHLGTPLLLTAGPGSGKTRVIIERIKFLIKTGIDPSSILCLTFSEKAANLIKERLEDDKEIDDISEMHVSTYHSFCRELLVDNTSSTGIAMRGGIMERSAFLSWGVHNLDNFDFDEYVVIVNNEYEVIENMIDGISVFSQELVSPEDLRDYVEKKLNGTLEITDPEELDYIRQLKNLVGVYEKYVEFKRSMDVMDYDDLIVEANKLLSSNPSVLESVKKKFSYVLIDEFQDNNFAQFEVVKKIASTGNLTAVGDPDQNIYSFQGAYRGIFQDFRKTFQNHTEIILSNNYRNPPHVTGLANDLLNQDAARSGANVVSKKNDGELVNIVECTSEHSQVQYISESIRATMNANPTYRFKDFAVFSRSQKHGMKISENLVALGFPVNYFGNAKMRSSESAQIAISFLKIISNPMNAMVPIIRILQHYDISEENIYRISREAKIRARSEKDSDCMYSVMKDLNVDNLTQKKEIGDIFSLMEDLVRESHGKPPSNVLYWLIRKRTDIYRRISNDGSIRNFVERSILKDMINNAYDLEVISPNATIEDFLNYQSTLTTFDIETNSWEDVNAVQVSTIHKSKGTEFKVVFLIDIATYKIPLRYQKDEFYIPNDLGRGVHNLGDPKTEHRREERRILYVGMTRAEDHLHITYPVRYEESTRGNKASIFIQDLKPQRNSHVNFIRFDAGAGPPNGPPTDRIDAMMISYREKAIRSIETEQYNTAVQRILDLAKISHFKQSRSINGFSSAEILSDGDHKTVESELNGIEPTSVEYQGKEVSFTKLDDYESCPKKFWYKYVLGALPENQSNPVLFKGSLFHKIVEESANREMKGVVDNLDKLKEEAESKWEPQQYLGFSANKENQDKQSVEMALKSYHQWNANKTNEIVATEKKFSFKFGEYTINGKIDRIEKTPDGDFVIIDFKTGGKNKDVDNVNESLQLNIYALVLESKKEFGKLPKTCAFLYPEKVDSIYFPYEVNKPDIDRAKAKLSDLIAGIDNGHYDADPDMIKCGWCDYKDICGESASR